jgi:elongation factor P
MGTIKAGDIAKGTCLLVKDAPCIVTEREFVNPGKGSAFVRLKAKNLKDGRVIQQVCKTHETMEEISVEQKTYQYLYADESSYVFMDTENYEQMHVPIAGMEDRKNFLLEGQNVKLMMWEETPIDIVLPLKMVLKVTQAENGEKGDTVSGATKSVIVETGLSVKTPLFIRLGDRLLINTESYEYVERVNS